MSSLVPGTADGAAVSPPIVAVVGNPRPGSRTAALARRLASAIADRTPAETPAVDGIDPIDLVDLIDLAELTEAVGPPLGAGVAERYATPLARIHAARVLIVATPTYKGSYTGLLKSFLDQVGGGALHGVVAIPVTTVGSPAHTLAAEVHLRPLLVELGASLPTSSLVVGNDQLEQPDAAISAWLELNGQFLEPALSPAARVVTSVRA